MSVSFEELSFRYKNRGSYALKDINAKWVESSSIAIMGHEGAGKSTLCYSINGIVPHFFKGEYSGRTIVFGTEVKKSSVQEMAKKVGLVFQDFESQIFSTNVELEVAFGLENLCLPKEEMGRRVDFYLAFVGLKELKKRDTATLSGGQKQRLAIASVLAMEQPVIVMDEPLSDLDPVGKREILEIREKLKDEKRLLIIVENDPENVLQMDEIWIMKEGRFFASGRARDIIKDVPLLESAGIMVPKHFIFFKGLGFRDPPLTFEDSIKLLREKCLLNGNRRFFELNIPSHFCKDGIIEFRDVHFSYPGSDEEVLKGINLVIREGDFVAIVGSNGSGKTTLAKHANGLLKPTKGAVLVKGKDTRSYKRHELARTVGYVFQNPDHQICSRTVFDEVSFGLRRLGIEKKYIEESVEEALFVTGLSGYEHLSPFLLSKGERQRVACASILALKPQVLILDEPTTGLDFVHQVKMMEMLKKLNERGHTIIIITHSIWVAETYAKRSIVMRDGRIEKEGPTREVFFDEETLLSCSVYPSTLTRIANFLKTKSMEPEEMIEELKNEGLLVPGKRDPNS